MTTAQIEKPASGGAALSRLLNNDGAVRRLSLQSGVSAVTLRSIAASGTVSSYVTAMAIELATDGAITAESIVTPTTKGADLYRREPARTLLLKAFEQEITIARLLARYDLTQGDLWNYMNAPAGKYEGAKEKVCKALQDLSIPVDREGER